ncbi:cholesterol esterase [Pseudocyphellaria aurata]|nr:cholesterol esterase [Pseudocyphellaria aurata]
MLVERGYDCWLGNNRGNKYSKKSTTYSPTSNDFWNFSIDQFAFHDIPDSINYILATTSQPSLSYVGFSQGTAQAFATLSIHPTLNDKVDIFIALAPAMSPAGLYNSVVDALMKASPEVIFLAFGRRSILSSATMWQSILYPPIFVHIIDLCLSFLFNWKAKNISENQKLAAYPHLYSLTSTKSVVHWFQIIRNKSFQMYFLLSHFSSFEVAVLIIHRYDDDVQAPWSLRASDRYYKVAKFPTRNIKTPIVLVYGGSDSLVDIDIMLRELPKHTVVKEIPHFEHLDFLWAQHVETLVFPHVFDALETYAGRDHRNEEELAFKSIRNERFTITQRPNLSEDDGSSITAGEASDLSPAENFATKRDVAAKKNVPRFMRGGTPRYSEDKSPSSSSSTNPKTAFAHSGGDVSSPTQLKGSRQEHNNSIERSGSLSSTSSLNSSTKKIGDRGISIGASKAIVGGVNSPGLSKLSDVDAS